MLFKEREFIEYLLLEKEVGRISDVCSNLSLSLKEVEELVQSVNNLLPHESIILVGDRIQVSEKCADELYAILIGNQQFFNDYDHNIELRQNMVEIYLMVHKSQESLQTLSDKFYVSRNTMFADLKQIKGELKKLQLVVEYSRKTGYLVKGPEYLLRNRIVGTTRNLLKTFYGKSQLKKFTNTSDQELKSLRNMLTLIEEKTQIRLTDEQIEDLPYILAVLMKRIRNYTDPWKFSIENYDIKNTVEYSLIKEQLNQFPFLKENDILYLSLQILSSNRIESVLDFSNSEEIKLAVDQFVEILKYKLAVEFVKESEFKKRLLLHIQPAIFRNILGLRVNNPLTHRFMSEHCHTFNIVKDAVAPFSQIIGNELSDEEIVYLSMIVLGWIYHSEESKTTDFKGVVLCPNGTSISQLLLENLKDMFPQIDFVGAYSFRQFEQMNLNLDFIFTTRPIKSKVTTIIVPPFLEPESRKQLRSIVFKLLKNDPEKQAKTIVGAIKHFIPEHSVNTVEKVLKDYFDNDNKKKSNNQSRTIMKLSEDNISIIYNNTSWSNCLDVTFKPMLDRGSISVDYVEKCRTVFYQNYDHMLIGPNVYLPHAEPNNYSLYSDIQFTIFKQAVFNPNGIPFHIMIGLLPSQTKEHVPILFKLNDIFLKKDMAHKIIQADTKEDVLRVIEGGGYV